ncbi:hypothetical protein H920_08319 [Fukomys damarensis]|uniref:Biopterin-dependent aromatic amino acid hydroxylase family profile domain-containing protein n=1 Tax=Fukomys damarensis TaxID=885580 RepID=A0A091DII3_FUKDA|nr:hypothetical protein H920_08319 [Fukomys damarensis]
MMAECTKQNTPQSVPDRPRVSTWEREVVVTIGASVDLANDTRKYALEIKKAFSAGYNLMSCSIDVLDAPQKVKLVLNQMKAMLESLCFDLEQSS